MKKRHMGNRSYGCCVKPTWPWKGEKAPEICKQQRISEQTGSHRTP